MRDHDLKNPRKAIREPLKEFDRGVQFEHLTNCYNELGHIVQNLFGDAFRPCRSESHTSDTVLDLILRVRKLRSRHLPIELFFDPAWDMLLELKKCERTQRKISITSLCYASGVSSTTALRHINKMAEMGMIERVSDQLDGRRAYLSLSEDVSKSLDRFLDEAAKLAG